MEMWLQFRIFEANRGGSGGKWRREGEQHFSCQKKTFYEQILSTFRVSIIAQFLSLKKVVKVNKCSNAVYSFMISKSEREERRGKGKGSEQNFSSK